MRSFGRWDRTLGDEENARYGASKSRNRRNHGNLPPRTDEDDDQSSSSSGQDDVEDRLTEETVWLEFNANPPEEPRILDFHETMVVNEKSLNRFIRKIERLPEYARPVRFRLQSKRISDTLGTAYRMDQLMELFKENLHALEVQNLWTPDGSEQTYPSPYARQVYSEVLGSITYLENLSELRIHKTNLYRPASLQNKLAQAFSSKFCNIDFLEISECNLEKVDVFAQALERYDGLEVLHFRDCGLNRIQLHILMEAIENSNSQLTHLDLSLNALDNRDLPCLSAMLTAQRHLSILELWSNHLFEKWSHEEGEYEICNDDTGFLQVALSVHDSLRELDLANCDLDPVAFQSLMNALTENETILKLNLSHSCDSIRFDNDWVNCLPRMKCLRTLYGLEHLTRKKRWEFLVAPTLRQNLTLCSLAMGADSLEDEDEDGDLVLFDSTTSRTLSRNACLHRIAEFNQNGDPPLSAWPWILEKFATRGVEESALFLFLQTKSAKLQNDLRKRRKRTTIGVLEEENVILQNKVQELTQENLSLRLENELLIEQSSSSTTFPQTASST